MSAWLKDQLRDENSAATQSDNTDRLLAAGCLGPAVKAFVMPTKPGTTAVMSKDRLSVTSRTAFTTLKANCCVFRGRWMYEALMHTKGIMQIGWCSAKCQFTIDTGVGDTRNSYGLDGSKQRLWHVQTRKYGPCWCIGDTLGVCLDMDAGRIEYWRNGRPLGEAFAGIERGVGVALFPAVSLAYHESIAVNFGGTPFRYPVEGYEPLQARPEAELYNAERLLEWAVAVAMKVAAGETQARPKSPSATATAATRPTSKSVLMVTASALLGPLQRLVLNSAYVLEDKMFACLQQLHEMK